MTAVREAEEAGLLGELTRRPIGRYRYKKQDECYDMRVYVMRVTIVLEAAAPGPALDGS